MVAASVSCDLLKAVELFLTAIVASEQAKMVLNLAVEGDEKADKLYNLQVDKIKTNLAESERIYECWKAEIEQELNIKLY